MTEQEWKMCTGPTPMLELLRGKASDRKFRLFAVACCRSVWDHLSVRLTRPAAELAERYADQLAEAGDLAQMRSFIENNLDLYGDEPVYDPGYWACGESITDDVRGAVKYAASATHSTLELSGTDHDEEMSRRLAAEATSQAILVRDIFGNPFHPVTLDADWLTSTVVALARGIYDDRAFDRLPILADALQDAGCEHADILAHCRDTTLPHVRGCWVVDLVLGKS